MKRLYFDVETTGIIPKGNPTMEEMPHVCQLAAILHDDEGQEAASMSVIIKPEGWTIPEVCADIHGIDNDYAAHVGIPIRCALSMFAQLFLTANETVAHNIAFDSQMLMVEFDRLDKNWPFADRPSFCTMLGTMNICKIPGKFKDYKWPKLIEAYQFLFNESFDGAHDALADVRACARVHRHLIENNLI